MKKCFKCNVEKPLDDFYKHPATLDGRVNKCKECNKLDVRKNYKSKVSQYKSYDVERQRYNFDRIFHHRYGNMKLRVNGKAIRPYKIQGSELLELDDFIIWCRNVKNMKEFYRIWVKWVFSDFSPKLRPSIDRKNNAQGYVRDNIQWLSLSDNSKKFIN